MRLAKTESERIVHVAHNGHKNRVAVVRDANTGKILHIGKAKYIKAVAKRRYNTRVVF